MAESNVVLGPFNLSQLASKASLDGDHASAATLATKAVDLSSAPSPLKPGWKTSEFWMAFGMFLAGLWLMSKGKDELGTILVGASGLGHTVSRTVQKAQEAAK